MSERLIDGREGNQPSSPLKRKFGDPSPITVQEGQLTPEQRTETFVNQDVLVFAEAMRGRLIVNQEDGRMIRVDNPEGWSKDRVGSRYTKGSGLRLTELFPGVLGVFPLPVRRMRQSLISARSGEELGACVRLIRASRYDQATNIFVPMLREGDIANFFDLKDYEAVKLKFLDHSPILYFSRGEDNGMRIKLPEATPEQVEANQYLRDLVK